MLARLRRSSRRQVVLLTPQNNLPVPHSSPIIFPATTFRMNTSKSVSKQRTLTPFRMNTYKKPQGGGWLWLTKYPARIFVLRSIATKDPSSHPIKDANPERPSGARDLPYHPLDTSLDSAFLLFSCTYNIPNLQPLCFDVLPPYPGVGTPPRAVLPKPAWEGGRYIWRTALPRTLRLARSRRAEGASARG
jgi:hypothetical protein